MQSLAELLKTIVANLVDNPEAVVVNETPSERRVILELKVDQKDVGKVIGRKGRMAQALRTIMSAVAAKSRRRATLDIIDR